MRDRVLIFGMQDPQSNDLETFLDDTYILGELLCDLDGDLYSKTSFF